MLRHGVVFFAVLFHFSALLTLRAIPQAVPMFTMLPVVPSASQLASAPVVPVLPTTSIPTTLTPTITVPTTSTPVTTTLTTTSIQLPTTTIPPIVTPTPTPPEPPVVPTTSTPVVVPTTPPVITSTSPAPTVVPTTSKTSTVSNPSPTTAPSSPLPPQETSSSGLSQGAIIGISSVSVVVFLFMIGGIWAVRHNKLKASSEFRKKLDPHASNFLAPHHNFSS